MKNLRLSLSVLVCLLLAAISMNAQNQEKPYILTVTVNGVDVDPTKIVEIPSGMTGTMTFAANPNYEGLKYSVKKVTYSFMGQTGAAQPAVSVNAPTNASGVTTVLIGGTISNVSDKLQYTLEGIVMEKNGKKKAANIPLRDRSIVVRQL